MDVLEKWKQDVIDTCFDYINDVSKEETLDSVIDVLYETGFISPVIDSSGAIFIVSDNNILTL